MRGALPDARPAGGGFHVARPRAATPGVVGAGRAAQVSGAQRNDSRFRESPVVWEPPRRPALSPVGCALLLVGGQRRMSINRRGESSIGGYQEAVWPPLTQAALGKALCCVYGLLLQIRSATPSHQRARVAFPWLAATTLDLGRRGRRGRTDRPTIRRSPAARSAPTHPTGSCPRPPRQRRSGASRLQEKTCPKSNGGSGGSFREPVGRNARSAFVCAGGACKASRTAPASRGTMQIAPALVRIRGHSAWNKDRSWHGL